MQDRHTMFRRLALGALGLWAVTAAGDAGLRPLRPFIAAHRGGALVWPENSLTAFRGALALGADLLELDVHLTRDGEVVVLHDSTLERTTTGRGAVREHTWRELAAVSVRGTSGEAVPRLRDVLDLVKPTGAGLLVEIKVGVDGVPYPGIEATVLGLLQETRLLERTSVMAFEWDTLERLRRLSTTIRLTGLLGQRGAEQVGGVRGAAERLAGLQANDLGIERTLLSTDAVAAAHAAGLTIGVWTVNEPDEIRRALAAGVDYVTTDRPDVALTLRGTR